MQLYFTGIVLSLSFILFACNSETTQKGNTENNSDKAAAIEVTLHDNNTPTVDIASYTLITKPGEDHTKDAEEIMRLKRKWPLAMQSLNPLAFDSILSRDFTFKGINEFFNRADYIKNRTTPGDWIITYVKYDNVTLQFVGETGILTYANRITNKNTRTNETEYEMISWMDAFVKEGTQWKLSVSHAISYQVETAVR